MSYDIKKKNEGKMSLTAVPNYKIESQNLKSPAPLKFFPFDMPISEDPCQNINKNLFKLEQEIALFNFAVREVGDITKLKN